MDWCFAAEFDEPRCSKKIIRAHSLQRNGVLSSIAENGHVLEWRCKRLGTGTFDMTEIGINKASTFRGFCSFHDNQIFQPLDDYKFTGTREQAFLLCLRALTHETHKKIAHVIASPIRIRAFETLGDHAAAEGAQAYAEGLLLGLRDMHPTRMSAWDMLTQRKYESVGIVGYPIGHAPPMVASGWTTPDHDIQGHPIQHFDDLSTPLSGTACFILPTNEGGLVGLAWLRRDDTASTLFESATSLDRTRAPCDILRFALTYSENFYFSPAYWRDLTNEDQQWFRDHLAFYPPGPPYTDSRHASQIVPWIGTEMFSVSPADATLKPSEP